MAKKPNRISEADLTIPALLAAAEEPSGVISTAKLISKLRKSMKLSPEDEEILEGRQDDHFSQIVRNIKSHKGVPGNLIAEGYFESVPRGFRITEAGRLYLKRKGY